MKPATARYAHPAQQGARPGIVAGSCLCARQMKPLQPPLKFPCNPQPATPGRCPSRNIIAPHRVKPTTYYTQPAVATATGNTSVVDTERPPADNKATAQADPHTTTHDPAAAGGSRQPGAAAQEEGSRPAEAFSWTARWWPVMPVDCLDPKIPVHVDLLDKSLAVWADSQGAWHCLEDRCPHRLAPLSEGRVEGDELMCSYHGWCFASSGACTRIPQLEHNSKAHTNACSSKRSHAASYPTRSAHGLLWVWPEAGPAAERRAEEEAVPNLPGGGGGTTTWFMRDMPLRYDTLMENVMDPSHVPFAHHGVLGSREQPLTHWDTMTVTPITPEGFVAKVQTPGYPVPTIAFQAPFPLQYVSKAGVPVMTFVVTPTKPGWTRMIYNSTKIPPMAVPLWQRFWPELKTNTPALDHVLSRNAVLDGDTYFLHVAERQLPVRGGIGLDATVRACFMPATADATATALRTWIQRFAGAIPTCRPEDDWRMPPLMTKEQVLDRWEQHTKHCLHCKAAVATIDKALLATAVVGALSAMAAVSQAAAAATQSAGATTTALGLLPLGACAVVALLCGAVYRSLSQFRTKFFFEVYTHATRG